MLPLHVGWCLPQPIPSSKIVLPTQKLTSYLTLKLTTHMLPYPKTQQKTQIPQATLPQNTPAKRCSLLPRSSDGSVGHAPTPTRMLSISTTFHDRPRTRSSISLGLVQRWLHGKDDESVLLQSGLHCCDANSWACCHRGGGYLRQWGRYQGGA
jgi:hypothetical protein